VRERVCALDELASGAPRAVQVGRRSLVLVRKPDGSVRALNDRCPHHGAKLSLGQVLEKVVDDGRGYALSADELVLRCPWHSYEFDVDTGRCLVEPERVRVRAYTVHVENGDVYVELQRG
jgi:nitrite reductase (NADH) small subunit